MNAIMSQARNAEWWQVAGVEFRRRLDARDAPRRRRMAARPDWTMLNHLALDEENIAEVVAGMGFTVSCGRFPAGAIAWWKLAPGPLWAVADAQGRLVCIDLWGGAWRTPDHHHRGASLIELGAWRWRMGFGQAGHRIARLCGWRHVPVVVACDRPAVPRG